MSETRNYTIQTTPPGLLLAMRDMLTRKGVPAAEVTGYTERSYNIGYCETCSELVTDVRIHYMQSGGRPGHYQVEYTSLDDLMNELVPSFPQNEAVGESDESRELAWHRHDFDDQD